MWGALCARFSSDTRGYSSASKQLDVEHVSFTPALEPLASG